MSNKRWFLSAPTWAITNFEAIRVAAISARVTLVDSSLKLEEETEAAGKPAEVLDPKYVENVNKPSHLAPTYGEVADVRNRIQSYLAGENQTRVAAGQTPLAMPTSEALEAQARQLIADANSTPNNQTLMKVEPTEIQNLEDPELQPDPNETE